MTTALLPRRISGDELVYGNLISSCRAPIDFNWLDSGWRLRLWRPAGMPRSTGERFDIEADWGGARLIVRAGAAWVGQVTQAMLGSGGAEDDLQVAPALGDLPELVRQAVLEAAFAEAAAQIETTTRKRFRVLSSGSSSLDFSGMDELGWECESNGLQVAGELWVDAEGTAFLATALRSIAGSRGSLEEWSGLPVPLRFAAGWVDLPTRTLAEVMPRDVIVLDESWLQLLPAGKSKDGSHPGYAMTVLVGKTSAFRAQLNGNTITVTAGLGDIMADTAQAENLDDEGTLDDVTIRLTFDLGERSVSIGELRSLAPGFTFDLGRDLRHAVTIRANGIAVGEGELVDIDGRVGVSVLTLNRFTE
ncbi:MAG: type III secretion system cytoplasmic ring protein SctQ [Janthinobacterium lividum]